MNDKQTRILVASNVPNVRDELIARLTNIGFDKSNIVQADSSDGIEILQDGSFSLVIADDRLLSPDSLKPHLLSFARKRWSGFEKIPFIVVQDNPSRPNISEGATVVSAEAIADGVKLQNAIEEAYGRPLQFSNTEETPAPGQRQQGRLAGWVAKAKKTIGSIHPGM